jgi:CHAD domain-containing protein/DNA-binding NarL/FixJ family response regulator
MLKRDQKELLENLLLHDIRVTERRRVHLLLMYDRGMTTSEIAREIDLSNSRVRYWKRTFLAKGMEIFPSLSYLPEVADAPGDFMRDDEDMDQESEDVMIAVPAQSKKGSEATSPPASITAEAIRQLHKTDHHQVEHILNLALHLHDSLKPIHSLPDATIPLLTAAVLLHDVGSDQTGDPDPLKSSALILDQKMVGFTEDEQRTIAAIVGSLRGKLKIDNESTPEFPALENKQAYALIILIRLAIGLDASQSQTTLIESITQTPRAHYIVVTGEYATEDAKSAQRAGKLWRKLFNQNLRVISEKRAKEIALVPGAIPFPEPMKTPGLKSMDTVAEAARKVLRYQFAQMLAHEEGTKLGEDIEELHDMRVPVRRMRVAFEIFYESFDPKAIKPHIKGLRRIGRVLGRVRDLDVFMEKADHYLDTIPEENRIGLDPLFEAWQSQREQERMRMMAFLESDKYRSFLHNFNTFVSTPGAGVSKGTHDYHIPHIVRHAAPIMINNRLGTVRAYDEILGTATIEQLHELRIEFKKLRYVTEFFREVLGAESKAIINEIKGVQDHLGDLNDAEVACQILSEFLENWEVRQQNMPLSERENPEPIVAYLATRHAERHNLMTTFGETWSHFERPEFRRSLALAVAVL